MSTTCARTLAANDAELHSCRAVSRDARRELDVVRRRQAELAELESELHVIIQTRSARMDQLLDERLRAGAEAPSHTPSEFLAR